MKGKKYPVACKTKNTIIEAAKSRKGRKDGGSVHKEGFGGNLADHKAKDIGALPDGGASKKHAGRRSRDGSIHGKPVMSAADGQGKNPPKHKSSAKGIGGMSEMTDKNP